MDDDQKWRPYYLGNPLYAFLLMMFFEWGVALHDLEVENIVAGKRSLEDNKPLYPGLIRKIRNQALKDYLLFPALTGPLFPLTFAGNATANLVRNIWAFNIIFCGHFPAGVATFSQEECEDESRGHWYYRQLLGSANITGGKLFHLMTGNLSHQIEHHLFPDLPARRYPQIAGRDPGDLRALRARLQHRSARQAAVQRGDEDLPDGAAGPQAEADGPGGGRRACRRLRRPPMRRSAGNLDPVDVAARGCWLTASGGGSLGRSVGNPDRVGTRGSRLLADRWHAPNAGPVTDDALAA